MIDNLAIVSDFFFANLEAQGKRALKIGTLLLAATVTIVWYYPNGKLIPCSRSKRRSKS